MAGNDPNVFLDNFIQGFSFIDDIHSRKRQERLLDERLEEEREFRDFQRGRQETIDEQRAAQIEREKSDRVRRQDREDRVLEGNALAADINTPTAKLQEYADVPSVAAVLAQRGFDVRDRADAEALARGGFADQVTGQSPPPTEGPVTGSLSDLVPQAAIPGDEFIQESFATDRDLNEKADSDPQAAMALRDAQRGTSVGPGDRDVARVVGIAGRGPRFSAAATQEKVVRSKADQKRQSQKDLVNAEWGLFLDVGDPSGDPLRNLSPSLLTAKYFDDRSNIDNPDAQLALDTRMRPVISQTIATQQEALMTADNPTDLRNAGRKLSEAYALAEKIGVEYNPLTVAGVDARGYPVGNTNQALEESVMTAAREGPGTPAPINPDTTRADMTVLNRGTKGKRVNERFGIAAYRQMKQGRITWADYQTAMNTGKLPGPAPEIIQVDPKKDLVAVYPDGSTRVITPARDPDKDTTGRNPFGEEAFDYMMTIAKSYNTEGYETRGTDMLQSFVTMLSGNEDRALKAGYDLDNVLDAGALYQRFMQMHVFRDAYNDEWMFNGNANPSFTQDFGSIIEAMFNPAVDAAVATGEFEDPRTTNRLGLGGTPVELTALKRIGNPATYNAIREQHPEEFGGASDDEIETELQAQAQGR